MASSNDGREKIQRLNEHNTRPIRLIGGSMKVFTIVSHISKPNWSSNSSREGLNVTLDESEAVKDVTLVINDVEVKLDMV